jgi:hypothetical protein
LSCCVRDVLVDERFSNCALINGQEDKQEEEEKETGSKDRRPVIFHPNFFSYCLVAEKVEFQFFLII